MPDAIPVQKRRSHSGVAAMPQSFDKQISALDGVRGLAILMVLLVHLELYHFVPGDSRLMRHVRDLFWAGWGGVDLFFVLSGFLITGILLNAVGTERYFYNFYMRRILRIFPLYYLAVTGTLLVTLLVLPHFSVRPPAGLLPGPKGWVAYFLYLQNWRRAGGGVFGHFWSLGVEEQFYLLWPLCVCYLSRRQLLRICVFAFFVCLAIRFFLVQHDPGPPLIERMTITRVDTLLVGAFCAIVVRDPDLLRQIRRWLPGVAIFSFLGMFMIDFVAHEIRSRTYYTQSFGYSFLALGFGAFVLWGYLQNERGTALDLFLQQGWLRSFGKYSYGIYVYHLPLFIAGEYLFARKHDSAAYCVGMVALSFGVARLSYAFYEKRFLNMKKRFEPSLLRKPARAG